MIGSIQGPVLALDTSTDVGSVAVGVGDRLLGEIVLRVSQGHSAALVPAIDQVLRLAGLASADLEAVVVGSGPGSFTGLRIGAATAKGIVHTLELPLLAYPGLLAVAATSWGSDRAVCAMLDARRRDVFAACYRPGTGDSGHVVEEVFGPMPMSIDEVIDRFRGQEPPLFAGTGAVSHKEEIERELGARVLPPHLGNPRASSLLWLAWVEPERGRVENAAAWEPYYGRPSGAERIAAAKVTGVSHASG